MKFNAIRDFLAVAERGSLRAAARQIGGSQPAMSRSIQELERELGVVLFERTGTGVQLTSMGKVFLRRASSVHNELRRAQEELDQLRGETNGRLTMALSSVPHLALLPHVLRPFRQRYPRVTLDIIDAVFPHIELDLREGRIDGYIGPNPTAIYHSTTTKESTIVATFSGAGEQLQGEIAVLTKKGNGLIEAVQAALAHVIADGTYQKVIDRWGLDSEKVTESRINPPGLPKKQPA